ncbi:hypothetical protein BD779DRAFT_1468717 [Infundibulicybe gibba]|nr:hypothetical protein BD779DRAFT_1468717 [Infundibulicybe gibba]
MSHLITNDTLLSPVSVADAWDMQHPVYSPTADSFTYNYYNLPPSPPNSVGSTSSDSPVPTSRMLKMRMSPDSASSTDQLCLPTHQVFDLSDITHPPTPPSPASPKPQRPSISISPSPSAVTHNMKRSASPAPSVTKKPRAVGERINSKIFKREARLVKNRAAAFLSRQRKREEFECMEVRVAELEQENAKLLALAQSGKLISEIEQLRAQLVAAKERERELELATKAAAQEPPVKLESLEPQFSLSSPPRSPLTTPPANKSAASLGLMVLLCALPTLLSMPTHSTSSNTFPLPATLPPSSATFDFNSFMPNDYDWSRANGNSIEMDSDEQGRLSASAPSSSTTRTLEFTETDSEALASLGGLDISFDTSPSDNGKIRVRIHPASSYPNSKSETVSPTSSTSSSSSLGMWAGSNSDNTFQPSFTSDAFGSSPASAYPPSSSSSGDPFLGIGTSTDFSMPYTSGASSSMMYGQLGDLSSPVNYSQTSSPYVYGSEYNLGDNATPGKRRVRIALRSMPAAGGEGGEWEVQFC